MTPHGATMMPADLYPGGRPSTTLEVASAVAVVGAGVTTGRAVTTSSSVTPFTTFSISGEYVDVARSLRATAEIGTEVLKVYGRVVSVGVGTT